MSQNEYKWSKRDPRETLRHSSTKIIVSNGLDACTAFVLFHRAGRFIELGCVSLDDKTHIGGSDAWPDSWFWILLQDNTARKEK